MPPDTPVRLLRCLTLTWTGKEVGAIPSLTLLKPLQPATPHLNRKRCGSDTNRRLPQQPVHVILNVV